MTHQDLAQDPGQKCSEPCSRKGPQESRIPLVSETAQEANPEKDSEESPLG